MNKNVQMTLLLSLWGSLLITSLTWLTIYSNTPGEKSNPQMIWPNQSMIGRNPRKPTLVIFVHPHCPCSIATIGELERLTPNLNDKVQIHVVLFKPKETKVDWAKGPLLKRIERIPNITWTEDIDGIEARKFDAQTSGQTYLYSGEGKLIFSGGITPERGHMGDSKGREAILSYVQTMKPLSVKGDVFGCSLKNPERKISSD